MGDLSDCLTWSGDKGVSAAPTGTIHFSCRSMASGLMARTTHIIKSNGETTRLDYLMRQNEGSWRISDVYLDGSISQLAGTSLGVPFDIPARRLRWFSFGPEPQG